MNERAYAKNAPTTMSALYRRFLCAASEREEFARADISSDDAERGTAIHAAIASGEIPPDMDAVDSEQVQECLNLLENRRATISAWGSAEITEHIETVVNLNAGSISIPGTCDRVIVCPSESLVWGCDFKSGWGPLYPSALTFQATGYLCALMEEFNCERGIFEVIPTRNPGHTIKLELDLEQRAAQVRAIENLMRVIRDAESPEYRPSPAACRYCRARGDCPGVLAAGVQVVRSAEVEAAQSGGEIGIASVSTPRLLELWDLGKAFDSAWKLIDAEYRRRCAEGDPDTKHEIRETAGVRYCADPAKAKEVLDHVTDAEWAKMCGSPALRDIESAWRAGPGAFYPSDKAAKEALYTKLGPAIQRGSGRKIMEVKR